MIKHDYDYGVIIHDRLITAVGLVCMVSPGAIQEALERVDKDIILEGGGTREFLLAWKKFLENSLM